MFFARRFGFLSVLLLAAIVFVARAAEPIPLPAAIDPHHAYCNPDPRGADVVAVDKPIPRYPPDALKEWSEGYATFLLSLAEDGNVSDLATLDFVGPAAFRDNAAETVRKWRYKQRLRDGKPVPAYGVTVEVLFLLSPGIPRATHERFVRLYRQSQVKIAEKRFDEALALLDDAQRDQLNHFEQAVSEFAVALIANETGDWRRALFNIRHATFRNAEFLDKQTAPIALRMRMSLEAQDGQLLQAVCAFERLRSIAPDMPADDPAAVLGAKIVGALNGNEPLVLPGFVYADPAWSLPPAWMHILSRPKFSFSSVSKEVKTFRLLCTNTTLEETVSDDKQWTVPPGAGACHLFVFGAPGATFRLVEEW